MRILLWVTASSISPIGVVRSERFALSLSSTDLIHGALDYVHSSLTFAPENVPCYLTTNSPCPFALSHNLARLFASYPTPLLTFSRVATPAIHGFTITLDMTLHRTEIVDRCPCSFYWFPVRFLTSLQDSCQS